MHCHRTLTQQPTTTLVPPQPLIYNLFPYTTLFRSQAQKLAANDTAQMLSQPTPAQPRSPAVAEGLDVRKNPPLSKEEKCLHLTSPLLDPTPQNGSKAVSLDNPHYRTLL